MIAGLDAPEAANESGETGDGRGTTTFLVILFGGLAAIFAYVGWSGMFGEEEAGFYFVSAILTVLAIAFLFSGVAGRSRRQD